jgi:nicotinamide-nucleotide amidase
MDLSSLQAEVLVLGDALRRRGWRIATAESCTGGLVAAACTSVAGSSDWFERGFVSYSNAAKCELLGVDAALIARDGAVSESVASAMATGALQRAGVALAVAVTGIAGPAGATPGKPVGTVWLATARRGDGPPVVATCRLQLDGDRGAVRDGSVRQALRLLRDAVPG